MRVTSGLAPGQLRYQEMLQRWRAVGDAASDLISPGIEPQTFLTDVHNNCAK